VNLRTTRIADVMTRNCITVKANILAAEALKVMDDRSINGLIVVDADNRPVGALNMLDMVNAGVM
ncbi:MAG: arabinose-5-phosphate isomerase, partial [Shewanella sp.]|nr:arabinose-5-phosphate isomerase [Shewanella sp.]